MRGVVPESQERLLPGPQLDEVQRVLVLRPADPVLRDRGADQRGSENAQRRLVRNGEHAVVRAWVARADLLDGGQRASGDRYTAANRTPASRWPSLPACSRPWSVSGSSPRPLKESTAEEAVWAWR